MPTLKIDNVIELPKPHFDGSVSVEQALLKRRSVRAYKNEPLTLTAISQLLWSAQGVSNPRGYRTAPSAGALYPLESYVVVGNVNDLAAGIYKYLYYDHALVQTVAGDKRTELIRLRHPVCQGSTHHTSWGCRHLHGTPGRG